MLNRSAIPECLIGQFYTATDCIGAILEYRNVGITVMIPLFDLANTVAERARRTLLDQIDNRFNAGRIGVNPGFLLHPKYFTQIIGTNAGMGANSSIVMNCNFLTCVAVAPVGRLVGNFLIRESISGMRAIAKWLVA